MEKEVVGLQKDFAKYIGAKHALVVNSGTAALHASVVATDGRAEKHNGL